MIKLQTNGITQLKERLKLVGDETKYRSGRFALRKAAAVIAGKLEENAKMVDDPTTPNSIPRNVSFRWNGRRYRATGQLGFRVGIMGGAGGNAKTDEFRANPGGDTRYWRHLEFGTKKAAPKPFFRKTMADNAQKAMDEFINQYRKAIDRALKKVGL